MIDIIDSPDYTFHQNVTHSAVLHCELSAKMLQPQQLAYIILLSTITDPLDS